MAKKDLTKPSYRCPKCGSTNLLVSTNEPTCYNLSANGDVVPCEPEDDAKTMEDLYTTIVEVRCNDCLENGDESEFKG